MDWNKRDNISWRDLKVDNRIWSHNGLVLGKCIFIGSTGRSWDPDPFFKFENGMVLSGLFLEFTQIIEV